MEHTVSAWELNRGTGRDEPGRVPPALDRGVVKKGGAGFFG